MTSVIRKDWGVELAAPISGTLYEGRAGAIHDSRDPLVYHDGPEYRTLDEVESIATQLPGKPFTLLHPEGMVGDGAKANIIGTVVGGRVDGGYAIATIMVSSQEGLDAIKSNTYALSLGYRCVVDAERFQRKVVIDHLALVPRGRCTTCYLRKDACAHEGENMKLGTVELEVQVTGLDELKASLDAMKAAETCATCEKPKSECEGHETKEDCTCNSHAKPYNTGESMSDPTKTDLSAEMEALQEKLTAANAALTALEIEATNARKDADKLKTDLEAAQTEVEAVKAASTEAATKAKTDADEFVAKEMDTRVNARVGLILEASQFKLDADLTKLSDREIKVAVIKHVDGDEVAAEKSMDYVTGVYEGALKRGARADESRSAARVAINEMRKDGAVVLSAKDKEAEAKSKMQRESTEAWKNTSKK